MADEHRVCVGVIMGAHGVRGAVKLRSFTADPAAIASYGRLADETGGRGFAIALLSQAKGHWLARVEGVADRAAAEALAGVHLYVDRSLLPKPEEDEFYHADLIGLSAQRADGAVVGTVVAVHDFGAGAILELRPATGETVMLPFTRAAVPVVDLAGGRVVVERPAFAEDDATPPDAGAASHAGSARR